MPIYNSELYIRKALDSLRAQTFTDFELVISDNGSTDATGAICRDYAARDSRIRYLRQPMNLGHTPNFNAVLREARGGYFMWASDDDSWEPACLAEFVTILDTHPEVNLVFSNFTFFSHATGEELSKIDVIPAMLNNKRNNLIIRFIDPVSQLIFGMFRRSFLTEVVIQHHDFDWADIYLTYLTAAKGKIFVLNDFLFHSGVKSRERRPYSIMGPRIRYFPYFWKTTQFIFQSFSGLDAIFLFFFYLPVFVRTIIVTNAATKAYDKKYPPESNPAYYQAPKANRPAS